MKDELDWFKKLVIKAKQWIVQNKKIVIRVVLWCVLIWLAVDSAMFEENKPEEVTYNEFLEMVESGDVDTVYYSSSSEDMRFTLYNDDTRGKTKKELEDEHYTYPDEDWRMTTYPATETFREDMLKQGVHVQIRQFQPAISILIQLAVALCFPVILIALLYSYYSVAFGKKSKTFELSEDVETRFSDVIGHDEVIKDLSFLVDVMKEPDKYEEENGIHVPKGVLFSGEPGTGKTLLARAIAGESSVPFYYVNASNFIELYVGTGAKRVRALFKEARRNQPCIVFVDEIDAIGCSRNRMNISSEDTQTLNALLQEMDGFDKGDRILVIGATNNASKLDKALVRSGRFDRQIIVSPPENAKARVDLLEFFLKGKKVSDNVDLDRLSRQMVGYTGADIESVVNEAGLISLAEGSGIISMEHLEEAFDKKILKGNRKKNQKESKDLEVVAYHEAGHAVASYLLGVDIARATIVGTTSGVGGMVVNSEEDTCFVTDESLKHRVMIMYGGRCSERIKFGNVTNGASNDISQATNVLKMYVGKYGFDKDTGLLDVEMLVKDNLTTSDNMLMKMAELSRELEEKTMNLLETNYAFVELIAQQLLEKETLGGEAIKELLDEVSVK